MAAATQFSSVKEPIPGTQPKATEIETALLTGGFDRPYAFGLSMALTANGVGLDVIGSDDVDSPEMHATPNLRFLKLLDAQPADGSALGKVLRVLRFYVRLIRYAASAKPKLFHILWNNKLQFFDRTLLLLYFKLLGKKIVFTAHNVNAGKRDGNDSWLNRVTLKAQYRLVDHIFVHTAKMKAELLAEFGVREDAVTVIPFGINNSVPDTDLTPAEAKSRLGIQKDEKTILFFGAIRPYKGLEYLVSAFQQIAARHEGYRLIVAGERKKGSEQYLDDIRLGMTREVSAGQVIEKIEFIPDSETELYFKAADLVVLPYTLVFQSGVLFLAYNFGLPAVATDVGSFQEDILEGETGYVCRPCDAEDLARAILTYFESDLFRNLESHRQGIREHARRQYSWDSVSEITRNVYRQLRNA